MPAYNVVHKRDSGEPFHPKGVGNGYVLTFGDKRVYVAGDTENIPEMAKLVAIHCAFLPMIFPYTTTPEMVADVVLEQPKDLPISEDNLYLVFYGGFFYKYNFYINPDRFRGYILYSRFR